MFRSQFSNILQQKLADGHFYWNFVFFPDVKKSLNTFIKFLFSKLYSNKSFIKFGFMSISVPKTN